MGQSHKGPVLHNSWTFMLGSSFFVTLPRDFCLLSPPNPKYYFLQLVRLFFCLVAPSLPDTWQLSRQWAVAPSQWSLTVMWVLCYVTFENLFDAFLLNFLIGKGRRISFVLLVFYGLKQSDSFVFLHSYVSTDRGTPCVPSPYLSLCICHVITCRRVFLWLTDFPVLPSWTLWNPQELPVHPWNLSIPSPILSILPDNDVLLHWKM